MKWSLPHFDAHGSVMASMAAFKQHCALGFWRGALIFGGEEPKLEVRAKVAEPPNAHGGGCDRAYSAALKTSRSTS